MESIKNIRAFLAVVETQSFTAAAKKLFMTQPTITKRISQIEKALDNQIFYRNGSSVQLTSTGKILVPYAIDLIHAWSNLQTKINEIQNDVVGELNISCSHQIGSDFLPRILKEYVNKYPKVDIKLDSTYSLSIIDRVNSSEIEVGLVTINRNMPKIIESNIFEKKQLIAVIAKDHGYWSQSANNRIRYLNNIPVLSAPAGNEHHNILNLIMHNFQITSPELSGFSTLEVIRKLVENGFGWALITKDMMSDKLKEIPTIKDSIYVSNACIYSKKNQLSRPAIAFIEMCKKYGSLD